MTSYLSRAVASLWSAAKANTGVSEIVTLLTLVVAIAATVIASFEFYDAKRAFALNSIASIVSLYSAPKARYYDVLLQNADLLVDDADESLSDSRSQYVAYLAAMNLRDFLQGIEVACRFYFQGLLDEQQKRFIAAYIKGDIDLLLYGYDEQSGEVGDLFTDTPIIQVGWITPDGESADEFQPYDATRACLVEWEIPLEGKPLF